MKNTNLKIWLASFLMLAVACSIGSVSVSALSAEGESLLSGLVSAATTVGIDIDGIIGNFVSTTKEETTASVASGNAQQDFGTVIDKIGIGSDILQVTDLVSYLNKGGSFADWVYDNYGSEVEIPDSVKSMSTKEMVVYLMGTVLYPDSTTKSETTTKYTFVTQTTKEAQETTETVPTTETTTLRPVYTTVRETYKTGDVNGDGKVTASDARLALRAGASIEKLDSAASDAADVNGDGRVTAADARSILRYASKITNGF